MANVRKKKINFDHTAEDINSIKKAHQVFSKKILVIEKEREKKIIKLIKDIEKRQLGQIRSEIKKR